MFFNLKNVDLFILKSLRPLVFLPSFYAEISFSARSAKITVYPPRAFQVDATNLNTPLVPVLSNICPRLLPGTGMQLDSVLYSLALQFDATNLNTPLVPVLSNTCSRLLSGAGM